MPASGRRNLFSLCLLLEKVTRVKKTTKIITKPSDSGSASWLLITLVTKIAIIGTSSKNPSLICTLWAGGGKSSSVGRSFTSLKFVADC